MRENTADVRLDLRDACRRLTARQREVVRLTVEGVRQVDIGTMLGVSQQAVAKALAAARGKLEQSLN